MAAAAGTPAVPDEPVGAVLARLRRARGLTGAALADLVGMSQPKISRIERGQGTPEPRDVGEIARALGATEPEARALMERAERAHGRMTDWRPTSDSIAARQDSLVGWEAAATVTREFQPAVIPGLLQSGGYAKAIIRIFQGLYETGPVEQNEAAVLSALTGRIRRQEVLANQSRTFKFVLAESVLREPFCSPAEMLVQVGRLREISVRHPNVDIRIIPDGTPMTIPAMHGFVLLDDGLVLIEAYQAGLYSRGSRDLDIYRRIFDAYEEQAIPIEPFLERYEEIYLERLQAGRSGGG